MFNLSISDLKSVRFNEEITGRIVLRVEHGEVISEFEVPEDHIISSMPVFVELANRARLGYDFMKPSEIGTGFTGSVISHYENGIEISSEKRYQGNHHA